jgi:hypothetical protein
MVGGVNANCRTLCHRDRGSFHRQNRRLVAQFDARPLLRGKRLFFSGVCGREGRGQPGAGIVVCLNASQVFDPNANELTILLTTEDITDRKRNAEALRSMNAELEHSAYALAHDLREPLRSVVTVPILASDYRGKLDPEPDR